MTQSVRHAGNKSSFKERKKERYELQGSRGDDRDVAICCLGMLMSRFEKNAF